MKKNFTLIAFFVLLFCGIKSNATHLMGGNLSYTFVSFNPGNNTFTYNVELRIYRYCAAGSSDLPAFQEMGAYIHNPLLPNANKTLAGRFNLNLVSQQFINPPNPDPNCTFSSNVCVEEGIYQAPIVLPASTGGYHLIAERCCRNNNISNLVNPGGAGQVYYASIPPTATRNSSPTFASIPVPFICAGDTSSILNAAFDPDGDSLAYSFVTPYNGTSGTGNPAPTPPAIYPWPIANVTFDAAAGYSLANPFGTGGYAAIDSTTGLASYMSPNQGFYVVAVEVREYRNGVLIGMMRRDLQIIVIPCPVNNAPAFTAAPTTYTIAEGTNLCFNVRYTDVDADSIFLTATSPIFNSAQTNPPATFVTTNGSGISTAQFCWPTSCAQGRVSSYQFTVAALDNGCPAKTSNVVYTINVLPTTISALSGPDTVCSSSSATSTYSVSPEPFITYHWDVTGGTQTSGGSTATAGIQWTSLNGTVSVYAINTMGCHSDTVSKNVVASNPVADAGDDASFCTGDSITLGVPSIPNQSYQWTPSTGLSSDVVAQPVVVLTNTGSAPIVVQYFLTATQPGCFATDTVEVTVNPLPLVSALPVNAQCIDAAPVTLSGTPTGGTFSGTGVSGTSFNPSAAGAGTHTIVYSYSDVNGCSAVDSTTVTVHALPVVNAGSNTALCINAASIFLNGTPAGGTFSGDGVSGSSFSPATAGVGLHSIIYAYTDPNGCSSSDTLSILVYALPFVSAGQDFTVCVDGASSTLNGLPSGGTFSGAGVTGTTFNPAAAGVGSHNIIYFYSDINGCSNTDTLHVTVNALPTVNAGTYAAVCINASPVPLSGLPVGGTFSGTGVSGSSFNPATAGAGTHTITYAYTDVKGCSASGTSSITVNALPIVNAGIDFSICLDAAPVSLSGTPTGGTFTGNGVSANSFNPATAGMGAHTISYAYTNANGCSATDIITITVQALPTVTFGPVNSLCTTDGPVTLSSGSPSGGSYSGTGVSGGIFNPAVSGAGTFTLTYSYTDPGGCSASATTTITVFLQPSVSLASFASTCINSPAFALSGGTPSGGTYSGTGVSGGTFNPAVAGLGTHTITYTFTGAGGCTGSASSSISVGNEPVVTLSVSPGIGCQNNTIFVGYGPQSLVITATTSATNVTYAWYRDGVQVPGSSDTLRVTVAGVYTVVVTDVFGCSSSPANPASISTINVVDVRCGHDLKKVVLCHVPPGNPGNPQTLCIAPSAVPAHLSNHPGDCLGPCPNQRIGTDNVIDNLFFTSHPNPFTNKSIVEFTVFETSHVSVELYNIEGKFVSRIFNGVAEHDILYETEVNGELLPAGVYLIKVSAENFVSFYKLVRTK